MNINKIRLAGLNLTTIAYTMIAGIVLSIIQIIYTTTLGDIRDAQNASIIFAILYILCTVIIIKNLLSAGSNLTTCNETKSTLSSPLIIPHIIGITKMLDNLEVAQNDFNKMNWQDAKQACSKLGEGWRLPTKEEASILFQNKDRIGGFANIFYWSSTEFNINDSWLQSFENGKQVYGLKNDVS